MTNIQQAQITVAQYENPLYTWGVLSIAGLNKDLGRVQEALKSDAEVTPRLKQFARAIEATAVNLTAGNLDTASIFDLTKVSERFKAYIDDSEFSHMLVVDQILPAA